MSSCKLVDTCISASKLVIVSDCIFSNPTWFHQIIGALQYLTFMRLDICFVVNKVCQFMYAPTNTHWATIKHILRYLSGIVSFSLHITRSFSFTLYCLIYRCWLADSVDDRKSTGDYLVYFNCTPISWKLGKQYTTARSLTEVEYKALANDTFEVLWLQYLLTNLQITPTFLPMLWCDNLGATYLFTNFIFHAHTKHVEVDYHFVCDRVAKKDIHIRFIFSKDQLADVQTKLFPTTFFNHFQFMLRVEPPPLA